MRTLLIVAVVLGSWLLPGLVASAASMPAQAPALPKQCADGLDNDGDGKVDFPADPGCRSGGDDKELDDEPGPPPFCADNVDNDGDGKVDYPDDPGCASAADDDETDAPVARCADGLDNDGDGKVDHPDDPGCASAGDNDEVDPPAFCSDGLDNDGDGKVDYPADPGCASAGDDDETDPPVAQCADGVDNDGDGKVDHPADPGCASAGDNDETDPPAPPPAESPPVESSAPAPAPDPGMPAPATATTAPPPSSGIAGAVAESRPPTVLSAVIRLRGVVTPDGVRVDLLSVRAPSGAVIKFRCRGTECPRSRRAVSAGRTVRFGHFGERPLPSATLEVRVTKQDRIGRFTRFRLRPGRFPARTDRCLFPGRSAPAACP